MTTAHAPDPHDSLADFLSELSDDNPREINEYDDLQASELLRQLMHLEKQINDNATVAEHERKKITQWETTVNEPLQEKALALRDLLEQYARYVRKSNPKRKTIQLPYGIIKTQPAKPKWTITDAEAFADWATSQQRDDLVRRRVEPAMQTVKSALIDPGDGTAVDPTSGEVVPGISIAEPDVPFTVVIKPE